MALFSIGVDLGTTNSCVASSEDGKCNVIATRSGKHTIPSCVSFENDKMIIGDAAKQKIGSNVKNTVYDVKRLMGHKFSDPNVQQDIKNWGFNVEKDANDFPVIKVNYQGSEQTFSPQQISSFILKELGDTAAESCAKKRAQRHAVITVPAYFNDSQRRATIEAGELAGLNVLQVINEPTAAAIAYGYKYVKEKSNSTILVYDFGGGTFDVSIIEVKDNEITVKATGGDTHLGGEDINNNIMNHYIDILKEADIDLTKDSKKMNNLRKACDEAKCSLSEMNETDVNCGILEDNDIDTTLTRALFNQLNQKLFDKTIEIMRRTLSDSGLSKEQIKDVVLIGGSSRIPRVQEMLSKFFNGRNLNKDINPDEAVAIGAAILAEDLVKGVREKEEKGTTILVNAADGKPLEESFSCMNVSVTGRTIMKSAAMNKANNKSVISNPPPPPPAALVAHAGTRRNVDDNVINSAQSTMKSMGFKFPLSGTHRTIKVNDVISHSLGVGVLGDRMSIILEKNKPIPYKKTEKYITSYDNQTAVKISCYEGEELVASKNTKLYECRIDEIPKKRAGQVKFDITMDVNDNGILMVSVKETTGAVKVVNFSINL